MVTVVVGNDLHHSGFTGYHYSARSLDQSLHTTGLYERLTATSHASVAMSKIPPGAFPSFLSKWR